VNVLLFTADDELAPGRVRVTGRRARHVHEVLRASVGDELVVGRIDGMLGRGRVVAQDGVTLELEVVLERDPPAPHPLALALALPRPPSLRKVLQQATALGVKRFLLFQSARVEKSYWQSTGLEPLALREQLLLGLEQAVDTRVPSLDFARRFRDFAGRQLAELAAGARVYVADPGAKPAPLDGPGVLVLGPEGGFVPRELEALASTGAQAIGLGPRVLRVETAAVALLARALPAG
jgi:RsmE family RNA methyltransferase